MKKQRRAALLALLLTVTLAGCGAKPTDSTAPAAAPPDGTHAQENTPEAPTDPNAEGTYENGTPTEASETADPSANVPLMFSGTGSRRITGIDLPEGQYVLKCTVQYGFPYCEYDLSLIADGAPLAALSGVAYAARDDEDLLYGIEQGTVDPADLRNSCEQTFSCGVTRAQLVFHGPEEDMRWTVTIEKAE